MVIHQMLKWISFIALIMGIVHCRTSDLNPVTSTVTNIAANQVRSELESCVAIRGNGPRIFAHFGALARYHEHYKPFQGLAGSSSGSITSFVYESMMKNPLLATCGSKPCTETDQRTRLSFLLKSIFIYVDAFMDSPEIKALKYIFDQVSTIKSKTFDLGSFTDLIKSNPDKAWDEMQTVLGSQEIRPLVNGKLFQMVRESTNPSFHLNEIQKSLKSFGNFEATDPSVLLFPGFVDWNEIATRFGRLGDFYAGYGSYYPRDTMEQILARCSQPMLGKPWDNMQDIPFSEGISCKQKLIEVISSYRNRKIKDPSGPKRIEETPGGALTILISTSVLTDGMATQYQQAAQKYSRGLPFSWAPDASGVKVGYFATPDQAKKIQRDPLAFTGLREGRFKALPLTTWREILQTSPAEPGLSGVKTLRDGTLSAGGWIDLTPVLTLKAVGCQNTVLLTRPVSPGISGFAAGVFRLLGASEQLLADEFDPNPNRNPPSVASQALGAADAVLCAPWDGPNHLDIKAVSQTGYKATFLTDSPYWRSSASADPQIVGAKGRASCLAP